MKPVLALRSSGSPVRTRPASRGFASMHMFRLSPLVLALSAASLIAQPLPGLAACVPGGTGIADQIACSATDNSGVRALAGNDIITIQPGAIVSVGASNPSAPVAAIDGGEGNDEVVNRGSVAVGVSRSQAQSPVVPMPGLGGNVVDTDNLVSGTAIGITGGTGDDRLDNRANLVAQTATTASVVSVPLTLFGGDTVIATTTVESTAIGMQGGEGVDVLSNSVLVSSAASTTISSINVEHNIVDLSHGNANTTATATAIGMMAGAGAGSIVANAGDIQAEASARSLGVNIEMNGADAATADASLTVTSQAAGIQSGLGGGTIDNSGSITVSASSNVLDVSVNASYVDITIADRDTSDTSTTLNATATGIDAAPSTGAVAINQAGSIDVLASSTVHAIAIALASEGVPASAETLVTKFGIASIGINANSFANGVVGGSAGDTIDNSGAITVIGNASARQDSINVGMALITYPVPTPGIVIGSAGTGATAQATGLDGGAGDDAIANDDLISASADAAASALTVSVNLSGFTDNSVGGSGPGLGSLGASFAVADTTTKASATATGIQGGADDDEVLNGNTVSADAHANGSAIGVAATMNVEFKEGENLFSANATGVRSVTESEAFATGIDGGTGADMLLNAGNVTANAEAEGIAVGVSMTVAGTVRGKGGALNLAATDTSAISSATATGMQGGEGDDTVLNAGSILATSDADVTSIGVGVSVGFAKQGLVANVALSRAESIATATSIGIDGGAGADGLRNDDSIDARAHAHALAVSVALGLSGTADGVSLAAALTQTDAQATALGVGMAGGEGNDTLDNRSSITVQEIDAESLAASVSVELAGTNNGVAAGFTLADASASANSTATGLRGDAGDDELRNSGSILLQQLDANATSIGISVSLNAAVNAGVAAGAALTDVSVDATTRAVGMDGGAGNDRLANSGLIRAQGIESNATAFGVSFSASISMAGAAVGAAYADTSATTTTTVKGMDGGAGDDTIVNSGLIDLYGSSEVSASSIGVTINAALGVGGGAQLVHAGSTAETTTIGIDGGSGRNEIQNSAAINASAEADAQAMSVAVGVTLAFGGDATLADARTTAVATAVGINDAADATPTATPGLIHNTGVLTVDANAESFGTSISGNLRGFALGETTNTSTAEAFGIRSGDGASLIYNGGAIIATSHAEASGLAVAVTLAGKPMGNADTTATARSAGIIAGAGDDEVENVSAITATAEGHAKAVSIAVDLAGSAQASFTTRTETSAIGLDGGDGADTMINRSSIAATATASTDALNVSVSIAGTAHADGTTKPVAEASSMLGGAGNDAISHLGTIDASAVSHAEIVNTAWQIAGTSGTETGTDAQAYAIGLDGGAGDDSVLNRGTRLNVRAEAETEMISSSWTFAGTAGDSGLLAATAAASGISGGAGADILANETAMNVESYATMIVVGNSGTVFGNAGSNTSVSATATASGLDGGDGDDAMRNASTLTVTSLASAELSNASFSFAGSTSVDQLLVGRSAASGMSGGAGNDDMRNDGSITVIATSFSSIIGYASADLGGNTDVAGSASTDVSAMGMSGGAGDNRVVNNGSLTVLARPWSAANNDSSAGVFFSSGGAEARTRSDVSATGIEAGAGNSVLQNLGTLSVTADVIRILGVPLDVSASAKANGGDIAFDGGHGTARAWTDIESHTFGIRAGDGNHQVLNSGDLTVRNLVEGNAYTDPNGGAFGGYGRGYSTTNQTAFGAGIDVGNGGSLIHNTGSIAVTVAPKSVAGSDADGGGSLSSDAQTNAFAGADAYGIRAGSGSHGIANDGDIHVTAVPQADAWADSDGGHLGGNGLAHVASYSKAEAVGIAVGDGSSRIDNNQTLVVLAAPTTTPQSNTGRFGGPLGAYAEGYEFSDAVVLIENTSGAAATGIRGGNGDHVVTNAGSIEVTASPNASGSYVVDGGREGTNNATMDLRSFADAAGIVLGVGANRVLNGGSLTVRATPSTTIAWADGDGGPAFYTHSIGNARGVDIAGGSNVVQNDGEIVVSASSYFKFVNNGDLLEPDDHSSGREPHASAVVIGGNGNNTVINNGHIEAEVLLEGERPFSFVGLFLDKGVATGIRTASGNDLVVNNGTIETLNVADINLGGTRSAESTYDIAISTGAGNDTIRLGDGSVTRGTIDFGTGNDTLGLAGTPTVAGAFVHGGGTFALEFDGPGSFSNSLPFANSALKRGTGTYSIPVLNPVQNLEMQQGTLKVAGNYQFSPTGLFLAGIYADGSNGRFATDGVATLGGTLRVVQGAGLYRQGMSFDVLTAGGGIAAGSSFAGIELPASTALVSFHSEQLADRMRVSTDVRSISSVAPTATSGNDQAIAGYLDQIMNAGTGDFGPQFLSLQSVTDPAQFAEAFASLSPAGFTNGPTAALASNQRFSNAMLSCRVAEGENRFVEEGECAWGKVQGRMTKRDQTANAAAADEDATEISAGVQKAVNENWYAGFGFSYEDSELRTSSLEMSDGERYQFGGILKAVYGSATFSISLSGGQGTYDTRRNLSLPVPGTVATASQKIDFLSAHLRAGYAFTPGNWYLRPLVDIGISRTRLGAFTESGAGPANLSVQEQTEEYVSIQPAIEFGTEWEQPDGTLIRPYASIGATHYLTGTNPEITAMLQGAPVGVAPFTVQGDMDKTFANFSLGLDLLAVDGKSVRVAYDGQYSDNTATHAFSLKLSVPF